MLSKAELIPESWKNSYEKQVPKNLKHPRNYISGEELKKKLEENKLLIRIFKNQI